MRERIYKSKVDRWVYPVIIFVILLPIVLLAIAGVAWFVLLMVGIVTGGLLWISLSTVIYVIKDDELGVRSFIAWRWYPIDKIKSVRKTTSMLTAPANSFKRIAITFDRSVNKSFLPLEISPENRDGFIADLLSINPDIKVL